jgi:hypothetical protein
MEPASSAIANVSTYQRGCARCARAIVATQAMAIVRNELIGNASLTIGANVCAPTNNGERERHQRGVERGARPHHRHAQPDQRGDLQDVDSTEPQEVVAA